MTELASERWTWTVDSYEQAAAAGVFGDAPRVELLDGEVYQVSPMRPGHAATCGAVHVLLARALDPELWTVGSQLPVVVDARSEPEPDVWVAMVPAPGTAPAIPLFPISHSSSRCRTRRSWSIGR